MVGDQFSPRPCTLYQNDVEQYLASSHDDAHVSGGQTGQAQQKPEPLLEESEITRTDNTRIASNGGQLLNQSRGRASTPQHATDNPVLCSLRIRGDSHPRNPVRRAPHLWP